MEFGSSHVLIEKFSPPTRCGIEVESSPQEKLAPQESRYAVFKHISVLFVCISVLNTSYAVISYLSVVIMSSNLLVYFVT